MIVSKQDDHFGSPLDHWILAKNFFWSFQLLIVALGALIQPPGRLQKKAKVFMASRPGLRHTSELHQRVTLVSYTSKLPV